MSEATGTASPAGDQDDEFLKGESNIPFSILYSSVDSFRISDYGDS